MANAYRIGAAVNEMEK